MHARADRSGRAVLPVLPGNWFVMAVHDDGIAHATVEAAPGLAPQSLQLRAFDRMRVRVVDGEGKPVQGARFSSNGSSWSGGGTPEDEMLRQAGWQVSQWSLQRCESDAEGRADLLFLAAKGMQMRLEVRKEKRRARVQNLEVSDDPMEIVLK
jgi:hypothetical protein